MAVKKTQGISPASSGAILACAIRALEQRGVFDEVLDSSLKTFARRLAPSMPDHLFPDCYLVQPLFGNEVPRAGFALDAYERNYVNYQTDGSYFDTTGFDAALEPGAYRRVTGLVADEAKMRSLVVDDDSFDARELADEARITEVQSALELDGPEGDDVRTFLSRIRSLPCRLLLKLDGQVRRLVIAFPRTGPQERFKNAPYQETFVRALSQVGIDAGRLDSLFRACMDCAVPCYSPAHGPVNWLASTDVSHVELSIKDGRLRSCAAGIRITDRTKPYLHTTWRPTRIYQWHITDNCDQRCKHCYLFAEDARARCISTPLDQLLYTLDEIERRCADIHTMPSFAITGGDPILHPQFWEFAKELHRRGFLWAMMGNPFHLNDEVCRRLRSLGCARYQLSLDGMREFHDSLRKPGSFDATIAAIRPLKEAGIFVQLMATVSRQNLDDVLKCMDMAVDLGADYFVFARYCATSPKKAAELYPTPEEYRTFLLAYYKKRRVFAHTGVHCEFRLKEHLFTLLRYELGEFDLPTYSLEHPDVMCDGCHLGERATIASNGDILACRRTDSVVGNVREGRLADIEQGEAMRRYREVRAIKGCSECKLLMWCRGCRAVGINATGDLQAVDPMCWRVVRD